MGGDADEVAKIEAGNRALIAAEGRLGRVKAGSAEGPSKEAGSAQQERVPARFAARSSSPPPIADFAQFMSQGELPTGKLGRPENQVRRQDGEVAQRRLTVGQRFADSSTMK
jgi:hypothetical protein